MAAAVLDINALANRVPLPQAPQHFAAATAVLDGQGFKTPPDIQGAIQAAREIVESFGEGTDFSLVRAEVEKSLGDNKVAFQIGALYGDVLVPISDEWGWVALENRQQLLATYEEQSSPPAVSPAEQSVLDELQAKGSAGQQIHLIGDSAVEVLSPAGAVNKAYQLQQILSASASEPERSKLLARNLHVAEPLPTSAAETILKSLKDLGGGAAAAVSKTAVITQPHKAWQQVNTGHSSGFPSQLKDLLLGYGFSNVLSYVDTAVSLELFADLVSTARQKEVLLWYHQGHGSVGKLYATPQYPGPYITDQFIRNRADFPATSIYVYACATLNDDTLAQAFLDRGAASYCGWTWFCKASASVVDGFDAAYWGSMLAGQAVEAAVATVHQKKLCPYELLQGTSDFAFRGNGAAQA